MPAIGCLAAEQGEKDSSMVAARQFNQVRVQNDTVIKAGPRSVLEGEIFFYQNMPADVADLFPRLLSAHVGEPCTLTLERVAAITFTHMFVNRCITPFRLTLLMDALRRLHSSQVSVAKPGSQLGILLSLLSCGCFGALGCAAVVKG